MLLGFATWQTPDGKTAVLWNAEKGYDKTSPMLIGNVTPDDIIKERNVKDLWNSQTSLPL